MIYPFPKKVGVSSSYDGHLHRNPPSKFPGTDYLTNWGTEVYSPFSGWLQQEESTQFQGAVVASVTAATGEKWYFLHLKDVVRSHRDVVEGELIAYTGNSGNVSPKPTPTNPYAGSHCHVSAKKGGKFFDVESVLASLPPRDGTVMPSNTAESDRKIEELEEKYKEVLEALQLEKEANALAADEKRVELENLESTLARLDLQLNKYTDKDIQANLIYNTAMETSKNLSEKVVDSGKYVALAGPIGALLGLVIAKALNVTGDEVVIITGGATALVDIGLVILNHYVKIF